VDGRILVVVVIGRRWAVDIEVDGKILIMVVIGRRWAVDIKVDGLRLDLK
jgi:hypothetical protein